MDFNPFIRALRGLMGVKKPADMVNDMETVANGFWEMYTEALTYHGRYYMYQTLRKAEDGEFQLDPKVAGMFKHLLYTAPYKFHATFN